MHRRWADSPYARLGLKSVDQLGQCQLEVAGRRDPEGFCGFLVFDESRFCGFLVHTTDHRHQNDRQKPNAWRREFATFYNDSSRLALLVMTTELSRIVRAKRWGGQPPQIAVHDRIG